MLKVMVSAPAVPFASSMAARRVQVPAVELHTPLLVEPWEA
jgi:hypothetical protein